MNIKKSFKKIICVLLISLFPIYCLASSLNISWDRNIEEDIAGYKLFYGSISNTYTNTIDVGNVISYSILNPSSGKSYYVSAKAYDRSGNESPYSDEIYIFIPLDNIALISPNNGEILSKNPVFVWSGDGYTSYKLYIAKNNSSFSVLYSGTAKNYIMSPVMWYWYIAPKTTIKWYVSGITQDGSIVNSGTYIFQRK